VIKGILYLFLFTIMFISCDKDTTESAPKGICNFTNFRYYRGAKDTLGELSNNYILVVFDTIYSDRDIRKFIASVNYFDQNYHYTLYSSKSAVLKFSNPKTCEEITDIIFNLQKNPIISSARYTMKTDNCQSMIMMPLGNLCVNSYSSVFYVKVFDENNLTDLYKMIAETKTVLIEQNQFMPKWFTLRVTKNSKGDTIQMANYFYESKLFASADPEINVKFPVE